MIFNQMAFLNSSRGLKLVRIFKTIITQRKFNNKIQFPGVLGSVNRHILCVVIHLFLIFNYQGKLDFDLVFRTCYQAV